jgi:hypothetical protein
MLASIKDHLSFNSDQEAENSTVAAQHSWHSRKAL